MNLGAKQVNLKKRVKEKDERKSEIKLFELVVDVDCFSYYPYILDELIALNFNRENMNFSDLNVALILYCILVNGLDKTKGEKFNEIKKEIQPLIKILKEIFYEFDKNEIHKERTFIFPLKSSSSFHDDEYFYVINNKEYLEYSYDDLKSMFLRFNKDLRDIFFPFAINSDEKDERKYKNYSIVLNYSLQEGEKEHKL